ncbi:uncharacterized protein AMSG_04885 [Thecamonas trahens ATCC 50062]|uniref:Uncharacterized protein n=1 Tax=Thecamonas trahens ATCC 50062 TaxID=461836 RepID=A0A0L0DAW4_THETB|nr:hypothetical protein AMSG_04885 [Thecamonas trahens ATCC 50062]KNC48438.1 hypothetical protein AMSG_04885 [Thecamonas trahens ATCC 50062]|eukprot:XP_013758553.1 hypothetical protein AMSG_04885 [Thecamonas trahens ATCC 50062]
MAARIQKVLEGWEPVIDREVMELAMAHTGSSAKMLALLDKAVSGEPIKVQLLGSSVVGSFAGRTALSETDLAAYGAAVSGWDATGSAKDGYFKQAFEATFGVAFPHDGHRIINSGTGSATVEVYAGCSSTVLRGMDMYVLEPTIINIYKYEKSFETVLRLFATRSPDAHVVMWHMFRWCSIGVNSIEGISNFCSDKPFNYDNMLPLYTAETVRTPKRTYVPNDRFADIAEYYGASVISVRNGFFHAVAQQADGFGWDDMLEPNDIGVHPNAERGTAMLRDLWIFYLRTCRVGMVCTPLTLTDNEMRGKISTCYHWDIAQVGGNPYVQAPRMVDNSGFEFVDETAKHKLGLAGMEPGDNVVFEVDAGDFADDEWREGQLTLMYLTSHQHMGRGRIECLGGCGCETTEIEGHIETKHSVIESEVIPLVLKADELGRAHKCQVQVTVLDKTKSEGHKVKLVRVVFDVFLPRDAARDGATA